MSWSQEIDESMASVIALVRSSGDAQGRVYENAGCSPEWLAAEVVGHCGSQGWSRNMSQLQDKAGAFVVALEQGIVVLVEGTQELLAVRVLDVRPEKLKTQLALSGAMMLTGLGALFAVPNAAFAVWNSNHRKSVVRSLMEFVDARVTGYSKAGAQAKPIAEASVAQRLRELEALKTEGIVTDDEYHEKRRSLLEQL